MVPQQHIDILDERIRKHAGVYFPGLAGKAIEITSRRFGGRSSYPLLEFDLRLPGCEHSVAALFVKFAPVWDVNNEGLTEYKHLKLFYDKLGNVGHLRVPRPLDFYSDINALVTEKAGGVRFSQSLLKQLHYFASSSARKRIQQIVKWCGEWLALFHRLTDNGMAPPFGPLYHDKLTGKIAELQQHGFPNQLARRIEGVTERLKNFSETVTVPLAGQHGDYGPQNVHHDDDSVYVFDLNYHLPACVYDDVSYFLVTLETMNAFPRYPFYDSGSAFALEHDFLLGYFGTNALSANQKISLEGYRLKSLLFRCMKQRRNMAARGQLFVQIFDRFKLRSQYPQRIMQQCHRLEQLVAG